MKDYKLGIGQISNITNLKLDIESMVIGYPMANENEWLNSLSENMIELKLWTFWNKCEHE